MLKFYKEYLRPFKFSSEKMIVYINGVTGTSVLPQPGILRRGNLKTQTIRTQINADSL